jgi:MFS family permease
VLGGLVRQIHPDANVFGRLARTAGRVRPKNPEGIAPTAPGAGVPASFFGRTISVAGNAFTIVALAFAVLELTGSKADLGYVLAAQAIPLVIFMLFGGVWADRLPRNGSWSRRTSSTAPSRRRPPCCS